ncbi:MAG: alpha-mannosidase, partial [Chloroflexi bacterium]|nr:alpha-mannosidase [Chloroflexota bacterium]
MHHTQVRRTLVVVSHSHWDREWYQPFQYFRTRLVRMLDKLLDLFDRDPDYRHFVLDGQTIVLEDYLEVRPDRRPDIERHVREGRLLIGPHYMLPDEFLIGGESHVRNLLIGMEIGRQFGPVMMVGYSPDAFGHIAHLPAVLRGFGIDAAVFWRGVSHEATTSEFRWAAPDGSEVLALHLPFGYALGMALPADPSGLRNRLQNLRGLLEPLAATRYLVVPNGNDHAEPQEDLSQVIRGASGMLDDADMVHGHYPMLVEAVKSELNGDLSGLPRLEGELRSSARSHVLAGVLSARMWIKQRYQECEDLLARWAEPLAAWAHLIRTANGDSGDRARSDAGLLRHAWKLLLQNGPHDSICGCSIDQVHEEMKARFDECAGIADSVLQENVRYLANLAAPARSPSVVVFNSENGPRTDFCRVRLPVEGNEMPVALAANSASVPLQL